MELHSGVAWRKKKTVTNAKWANLFPFFTKSTLDISKAELASFDWAFLLGWINIVVQLSLDSFFLKGILFRTGLSLVFHIDFFLKFQTTICQPGNHEAIQVENISIFLLSQPNTIFCATYFFSQSNGNVTYIQNFCSSSFLAFKVCLRRRRAWFFCNFINSFLKSFSH